MIDTEMPTFLRLSFMCVLALLASGCVNNVVLRERGVENLRQKDYVAAANHFDRAARMKPTDWESQYLLGWTLLKLNRPLDAQIPLEQALTLKPNHESTPGMLDALAESLYQQNRYETLHTFLEEAAAYWGTTDDYLRQGKYAEKTGDLDAAMTAYRKAGLWADADDARPYIAMADLYETLGDVPNTLTALGHAYWANPTDPGLPDRFRRHGIVPGPTVGIKPEKAEKPQRTLLPFPLPKIPGN
jgi:Flp pilus assembly protein TadD